MTHDFASFEHFKSVPANPLLARHQQTERACKKCGLVKITVHPSVGVGGRLYRWGNAHDQFAIMPECPGVPAFKSEAAQ